MVEVVMSEEVTHQRIYVETKRKLDSLSRLESRSTPQQLKVIVDREYDKHPELKGASK